MERTGTPQGLPIRISCPMIWPALQTRPSLRRNTVYHADTNDPFPQTLLFIAPDILWKRMPMARTGCEVILNNELRGENNGGCIT